LRGGMNVYPKELEDLLYRDRRIVECAVVGRPDGRLGEVPYAFVRLESGTKLSEAEITALVNEHAARFKHLAGARVVDGFKRTAIGKIMKRELRDQLAREEASPP